MQQKIKLHIWEIEKIVCEHLGLDVENTDLKPLPGGFLGLGKLEYFVLVAGKYQPMTKKDFFNREPPRPDKAEPIQEPQAKPKAPKEIIKYKLKRVPE